MTRFIRMNLFVLLLLLAGFTTFLPMDKAEALPLGTFSITNGTYTDYIVDPLSNAGTATDFYSGGSPYFAQENTGVLWLYENTQNNDVSLGFLLDIESGIGSNPRSHVNMKFSGVPDTAFVELSDDLFELTTTGSTWGYLDGRADGGLLGGLNNGAFWEMTIELLNNTSITDWFFLSGDAFDPDYLTLDMTERLVITDPPLTAVPEPSTFVLLGFGLVGLVAYKRRRKTG